MQRKPVHFRRATEPPPAVGEEGEEERRGSEEGRGWEEGEGEGRKERRGRGERRGRYSYMLIDNYNHIVVKSLGIRL